MFRNYHSCLSLRKRIQILSRINDERQEKHEKRPYFGLGEDEQLVNSQRSAYVQTGYQSLHCQGQATISRINNIKCEVSESFSQFKVFSKQTNQRLSEPLSIRMYHIQETPVTNQETQCKKQSAEQAIQTDDEIKNKQTNANNLNRNEQSKKLQQKNQSLESKKISSTYDQKRDKMLEVQRTALNQYQKLSQLIDQINFDIKKIQLHLLYFKEQRLTENQLNQMVIVIGADFYWSEQYKQYENYKKETFQQKQARFIWFFQKNNLLCEAKIFKIQDPCSICYEPMKTVKQKIINLKIDLQPARFSKQNEEKVIQLYCGHIYHLNCIKEWLRNSPKCPVCRKDFRKHYQYMEWDQRCFTKILSKSGIKKIIKNQKKVIDKKNQLLKTLMPFIKNHWNYLRNIHKKRLELEKMTKTKNKQFLSEQWKRYFAYQECKYKRFMDK